MGSPLGRTAKVIEPYISSDFRRAERAVSAAGDLHRAGLLAGQFGPVPRGLTPAAAATNLLQCRFSWSAAEQIVGELDAKGLLLAIRKG